MGHEDGVAEDYQGSIRRGGAREVVREDGAIRGCDVGFYCWDFCFCGGRVSLGF